MGDQKKKNCAAFAKKDKAGRKTVNGHSFFINEWQVP
jgi:hypothetical protein